MIEPHDPVLLYGLMRSAAWRCGGTTADDDDLVVAAILPLRDEVQAVDPHDRAAVIEARHGFEECSESLSSGLQLLADAAWSSGLSGRASLDPGFVADQRLWVLGLIGPPEF
jgi:hypothetical protein